MDLAAEHPSLAGYRIEAVAGRGGMGVVYRAVQEGLGRPVALKLIAPDLARDAEFRARFVRESRLAAALDHPHVIPVYEAGESDDGTLYIAMRWVDGPDLRELVAAEGPLTAERAADLVGQLAGALDAAHARGLVHRDVKPANVLLADGGRHAYLSDFGLALAGESSAERLTRTGHAIGTASYSSPEQIQGRPVDARSDVYALGCVLWFAVTGTPPFRRDTELATAWAHVHEQPPRAPVLGDTLRRALAKDPAERPQSAGVLAEAAAREAAGSAAAGSGVAAAAVGVGRPVGESIAGGPDADRTRRLDADATARLQQPAAQRRRALPWLLTLVAAVAAVAVVLALSLGADDPEPTAGGPPATTPRTAATPRTETAPAERSRIGATVPDVVGMRLDAAEDLLDERGIEHDVEGGGAFGVVVPENWTVCDTAPAPRAPLPTPSVTLTIDRDC